MRLRGCCSHPAVRLTSNSSLDSPAPLPMLSLPGAASLQQRVSKWDGCDLGVTEVLLKSMLCLLERKRQQWEGEGGDDWRGRHSPQCLKGSGLPPDLQP